MADDSGEAGRRGRPRKWGSEAERQRAYRERKAAELAEPLKLRQDLGDARRRVKALEQRIGRRDRRIVELGGELQARTGELRDLGRELSQLQGRLAGTTSERDQLLDEVQALEAETAALRNRGVVDGDPGVQTGVMSVPPGVSKPLSRQQRRAAERRERKRGS